MSEAAVAVRICAYEAARCGSAVCLLPQMLQAFLHASLTPVSLPIPSHRISH